VARASCPSFDGLEARPINFSRLAQDNSAVPMKMIRNSFIVTTGVSRLISKEWSGLTSAATNF
jgi:hypothetical protein